MGATLYIITDIYLLGISVRTDHIAVQSCCHGSRHSRDDCFESQTADRPTKFDSRCTGNTSRASATPYTTSPAPRSIHKVKCFSGHSDNRGVLKAFYGRNKTADPNVNVNVNLYSIALSHSASNALGETVLSRRPKLAMLRSGSCRLLPSAFQTVGMTMANARRPYVSSCILGATSRRRLAERRCCLSATWATGVHSSDRWSGSCIHAQVWWRGSVITD